MKVKLFCMDSLSSKKGPTSGALEEEDSTVILLREGLHSFHSRWHRLRRELIDQMTAEDATDITVAFKPASLTPPCGCFFLQFPSIKLSPTLMSSPPREISGGQQHKLLTPYGVDEADGQMKLLPEWSDERS
ncbi:hypothetical protein NQZ68_000210 [Dissostichus eleginoides]|nr:hypothetical protein NQZ68_000210 [Dissostichus eleginoides]